MWWFLVTYHGSGMPDDPALMEQAKMAFGSWVAGAGDAIVDSGAPVHMVTQVATEGATEAVAIGGYSIIQADSVEDATAWSRPVGVASITAASSAALNSTQRSVR